MSRAPSSCAVPGCPHVAVRRGRCAQHAAKPWQGHAAKRKARGELPGRQLKRLRAQRISAAGGRCQSCGARDVPLDLHHLGALHDYSPAMTEHCLSQPATG